MYYAYIYISMYIRTYVFVKLEFNRQLRGSIMHIVFFSYIHYKKRGRGGVVG